MVLTIMGLLAAMVVPVLGHLNTRERERITRQKMEQIRRALMGDPDRFDANGRRIIGGYVGDMEAWPDLWEAAPQVRETVVGTPPDFDPESASNDAIYYYRPMGSFGAKNWRWGRYPTDPQPSPAYRKLTNAAGNSDHIGGLETENEGQPRGLWTDQPSGEQASQLDPDRWKGPYLVYPRDYKPEDSDHLATDDGGYRLLAPVYNPGLGAEEWEEGDYAPADGDLGEHYDQKEDFRLKQTDGRLADAWDRAFRFFITEDPDHAGETLFWIISEGADYEGTYPTKGDCGTGSWTVDADDRMGTKYDASASDPKGYNPDDPYNEDNIVMTISSIEWRAVFAERNLRKAQQIEALMLQVRRALIGTATAGEDGFNSGYTGALCRWPALFRWEDNGTTGDESDDFWDDQNEDATPESYTKGQPRGLWSDAPNTGEDASAVEFDRLPAPALVISDPSTTIGTGSGPGIGWQGPYLPPPIAQGKDEQLIDGWGRELLFFLDDGVDDQLNTDDDRLLVLSRGADGKFDFATTDADYQEPASFTEEVDVTAYDPNDSGGYNADNLVMILRGSDWLPGWLTLETLVVENATSGITKARFVSGIDASGNLLSKLFTAGTDGSLSGTTWTLGPTALQFDSTDSACTGTRQLVVWEDNGTTNDAVDSGELQTTINYNLYPHNGHEPRTNLNLDTNLFIAAP